ncbi:MAG TPA: ATP-binding protein [Pyrinomonadaceae bacterium]|nr:ATP-binding protein [Pyrinomonadaceae bacterium]
MNDLQKDFIRQTVAELEVISQKVQNSSPNPEFLQEIYRKLHSIKGTAQVFALQNAANLAHKLEDFAAADNFQDVFPEGLQFLKQTLENENFQIPESFSRKIKLVHSEKNGSISNLFEQIPHEFTAQLSESELAKLNSLLEKHKEIYIFEIGFDPTEFLQGFKGFRQNLEKKGEIIASLPCPKFSAESKIGFQIIFSASENIDEIIDSAPTEIVFQTKDKSAKNLDKIIRKIFSHGKTLAEKLGKNIEFNFKFNDELFELDDPKTVFEILLHLVRNAVDHGIKEKGKFEISIEKTENDLVLHVADDGKGLDFEKIRAKAFEKKLISASGNLSENEISNLIFLPEFSTAETVSEISGRGIGLDAVKNLVENANGKISVKSENGKGVSFEIILPQTL